MIEKLKQRKKFFELWKEDHPKLCSIQLEVIELKLKELEK